MIKYETSGGDSVTAFEDGFFLFKASADLPLYNRGQLTELRHIIDQALNTSAEELGDA